MCIKAAAAGGIVYYPECVAGNRDKTIDQAYVECA